MFRHMLVPLDGSTRAEQVLPVAARLARATGGTLTLVTVVDVASAALLYRMAEPYLSPTMIEQDLSAARNYLEQVVHHPDLAGIAIEPQVVLGNPAAMILERAAEPPIDLIMLSSHGYTGIKRWVLGSVAEKIARHAAVPVLLLRDDGALDPLVRVDETHALRVLVPLDTSDRSQEAIPPAAALVAALSEPGQGQLHLTHLLVLPAGTQETERAERLQEAKRQLDAIGRRVRDAVMTKGQADRPLAVSWAVSEAGDIAEGIVRIAEESERAEEGREEPCDLIAMTTHGATGIRRWAMGSITERVLHATSLPLLITRPAEMIEQERQQQRGRPLEP